MAESRIVFGDADAYERYLRDRIAGELTRHASALDALSIVHQKADAATALQLERRGVLSAARIVRGDEP